MGGSLITDSNLIFIGAAAEHKFRAFELESGKLVWEAPLPRAGMASPMTYEHDGEQYVAIAAGGHSNAGAQTGDYLVSFKLSTR